MRSQTSMISAMLWSISRTPAPWSSRTAAHDRREVGHLGLGQPGGRLVHQHEATAPSRALAQRRAAARRRERASRAGRCWCAARLQQLAAARRRGRARRAARAPTPSAATSTFSRTVRSRNERECWKVRARPARPQAVRAPARDVTPVELDRTGRGPVEPGDQVDERRLAGAVRPDQADDLVSVQLDRDVVERLHARRTSARRRRARSVPCGVGLSSGGAIDRDGSPDSRRSSRPGVRGRARSCARTLRSSERPSRSRCR